MEEYTKQCKQLQKQITNQDKKYYMGKYTATTTHLPRMETKHHEHNRKGPKNKINMIKQIRDTHRRRKKQVKENDHTWKNLWHNATMAQPKK